MLAFAGIPLTSGFLSKFDGLHGRAQGAGQTWLVIVGVITSMILAFPYLRVVVMMWLSEPGEHDADRVDPGRADLGGADGRRARHAGPGRRPTPVLHLASKRRRSCGSSIHGSRGHRFRATARVRVAGSYART